MKKLLFCIAVAASPGMVASAHADEALGNIDLSTFTCKAFLHQMDHGHGQEMRSLAMWLDGYRGGISGSTEVNWHEFKEYTEDLVAYCRHHASSSLLEAGRNAGN